MLYFIGISTTLFGVSSHVEYTPKLNPGRSIKEISIQIRTLVRNGLILFAQNDPQFLKIRVRGGKIQVLYRVGAGQTELVEVDYYVSDGEFHTVKLTENAANMTLSVEGPSKNISKDFTFSHSPTINLTALIINEKSSRKLMLGYSQDANEDWFYKGCLREVRIGGVLLPFYLKNNFTNFNTSVYLEYFEAQDVNVQKYGCSTNDSCVHSQCKHSSVCQEDYYSYTCQCPSGYGGQWCETNKDDCATSPTCGQGGKCVDGLDAFTCQCRDGYSGIRWVLYDLALIDCHNKLPHIQIFVIRILQFPVQCNGFEQVSNKVTVDTASLECHSTVYCFSLKHKRHFIVIFIEIFVCKTLSTNIL